MEFIAAVVLGAFAAPIILALLVPAVFLGIGLVLTVAIVGFGAVAFGTLLGMLTTDDLRKIDRK